MNGCRVILRKGVLLAPKNYKTGPSVFSPLTRTFGRDCVEFRLPEEKKSMWENPTCCYPCPKLPFRHDIAYAKHLNVKRTYTRTWVECCKRVIKKKICLPCNPPPPKCRRPRKAPSKLLTGSESSLGLMNCKITKPSQPSQCPAIAAPCCTNRHTQQKCLRYYRPIVCCQKRCTPYPSYSECQRSGKMPKCPSECDCLMDFSRCSVLSYMMRLARRH